MVRGQGSNRSIYVGCKIALFPLEVTKWVAHVELFLLEPRDPRMVDPGMMIRKQHGLAL